MVLSTDSFMSSLYNNNNDRLDERNDLFSNNLFLAFLYRILGKPIFHNFGRITYNYRI